MAPQTSTACRPISETLHEPLSTEIDAQCDQHGGYTATRTEYPDLGIGGKSVVHVSRCPACTAEGVARREAKERDEANRKRQWRVEQLFGESGIPPRFLDRSFGTYGAAGQGQRIALAVCKGFAEKWPERRKSGASLVLTGGPGTGKTHLATAIANHVIAEHLATVVFGTVSAFLRHIKSTYGKDSQRTEQQALNDLMEPDLLIVDEIGVQVGSEHEKLLMFEVLNERYQRLLPTILISNLDVGELETFLGHRVMDRYRECGSVLSFDWHSHRGMAA